jgi:hypothetical protein
LKVYIINSITKSYILNIKIRPLVTEYALMIKLVDGTSSAHSFNPCAYFGHSWSYFDIQNLRLVILYLLYRLSKFLIYIFVICIFHSTRVNLRAMILRGSAGRVCHLENVKFCMSYLQQCTKIIKMLTLKTYFS